MNKLTDFQIRLLKIADHVRWSEEEQLDAFKYHLVRRALGQQDHVVETEMRMAVEAMQAMEGMESPPIGSPMRSPWMLTWDVSEAEYHAAGAIKTPLEGL